MVLVRHICGHGKDYSSYIQRIVLTSKFHTGKDDV